jgi:hypothetical protein
MILVLVVAILYFAFKDQASATPPPTITRTPRPSATLTLTNTPLSTPTVTRTLLPTLTSTITPTPTTTETPTLTPTGPFLPTLTAARPVPESGVYDLNEWSAEQADQMAQMMIEYPYLIGEETNSQAFLDAFQPAIIALEEALLRYPDDPLAEDWQWDLAYSLALTGDSQAGQAYGGLIAAGLNSGETDLSELYLWFEAHEPRLRLYLVGLEPIPGSLGSYLVEVRSEGGSAFIWLPQMNSGFQPYVLYSRFDYLNGLEAGWILNELNGAPSDGKELAIYYSALADQYTLDAPVVFNLGQIPARDLPFIPQTNIFNIGMEYQNYWAVRSDPEGIDALLFKSDIFAACPVNVRLDYLWNDRYFAPVDQEYEVTFDTLAMYTCELAASHAADTWGPQAAVPVIEALLPFWPPAQDENGEPYPSDAKDEWRYWLGVQAALSGDQLKAQDVLYDLIAAPTTSDSRFVAPAQAFLETYQSPEDIYRACVQAEAKYCDPVFALPALIQELPPGEDALLFLRENGVEPLASGYFDFDQDGETERWMTVRHRSQERQQLWILAIDKAATKTLFVTPIESIFPSFEILDEAYVAEEALDLLPVILVDSTYAFSLQRLPDTNEAYLVEVPLRQTYPNRFEEALDNAQQILFSGAAPGGVQEYLLSLQHWPGLQCEATWSCDRYYYLLGLASELANDEREAVDAYHTLWLNYAFSPYTTMARLKLKGSPLLDTATPTMTPTPSPTVMVTSTPTITGTPPTATFTPTATVTGGVSGTGTPTITLTPTPTPTSTATLQTPYP